ncbi:MAG TPA: hypothetical protein PKK26_15645, partial [Candidatus Wallbacteria bacterium]|nr:hypothetical protein [Candidatus Wallbacteria bacterium]
WQLPADASKEREDFALAVGRRIELPEFDMNDHFDGLIGAPLRLSVVETLASTAEAEFLGKTHTPNGYGTIEVMDNGILIDSRQEISDIREGKWWIHRVAFKSSIIEEHRLTPKARTPETFKAIIDILLFSYENTHWLEIREARIADFPDRIEYRIRGISYRGAYSYYKKGGGMGLVEAEDYRLDFLFSLSKSTGAVTLKPSIVDKKGVHHEQAPQIDLSDGKFLK